MSEQRLTYKQFLLSRKAELNKRCVNQAKDRFEFKPKSLKVKDNEEGDVYDLTNADDLWVLIKILNVYYELAESHKLVIEKYVGSDTVALLNEQQSLITALEKEHKRQENQIKLLNKQLSKIPPNIRKVWLDD